MKFHEEFLTILNVNLNEGNLILRLDNSDWFNKIESYNDKVLELKLINCQNAQKSFEEIKQNIGELIWNYEFISEKNLLDILMDDGSSIQIECAEIFEKENDLTIDELLMKFQWLQENYQRESQSSSKGWGKYQRLSNLLDTEIKSEIQNLEKKKIFFEQKESLNADKTEIALKLCRRILNYIKQIEKED